MQWIKANLNLVVTIAIGVLGITGITLGMVMSDVAGKMKQDESTLTSLKSIKGSNAVVIEEVRKHSEEVKKKLDDSLKKFESIGTHVPILPDVFPKIIASNATAPYRFVPEYKKALTALVEKLHAKDAPSEPDYRAAKLAIDDERAKEEREKFLGKDPNLAKSRPAGRPATRPAPGPAIAPGVAPKIGPKSPEELAKTDERVRASVKRAREIYCYATQSSFMLPDLLNKDEAPSVESMWYAQMALWIEQDVVDALSSVNQAVAEKLPTGEKPWVGVLPVKHLVKVAVSGYVPPSASAAGSMAGAAVFTGRTSNARVDVLQLTIELYLNPQYLPTVIKAISQTGFYTPLLVNYEAQPPTSDLTGYIYGSQPVIHATLQFECCFLRTKYEKWMPTTVATAITEGKAVMMTGQPNTGGGPIMQMQRPVGRPPLGGDRGDRNR